MADIKTVKYCLTLLLIVIVVSQTLHTDDQPAMESIVFQELYEALLQNPHGYLLPSLMLRNMKNL